MSSKYNLFIDQGTDFEVTIDVLDDQTTLPFDLTGYTTRSQIRKTYYSTFYYDFITSHNNALGQISLSISANTTNGMEPGRYVYDVEGIETSSGKTTRIIEGILTLTPGITR